MSWEGRPAKPLAWDVLTVDGERVVVVEKRPDPQNQGYVLVGLDGACWKVNASGRVVPIEPVEPVEPVEE